MFAHAMQVVTMIRNEATAMAMGHMMLVIHAKAQGKEDDDDTVLTPMPMELLMQRARAVWVCPSDWEAFRL